MGEITNVNYVPEFKHNLLSVNQLTKDGYTVVFTTDDDVIIHSNEGEQHLGSFNNGVYTTTNDSVACVPRPEAIIVLPSARVIGVYLGVMFVNASLLLHVCCVHPESITQLTFSSSVYDCAQ